MPASSGRRVAVDGQLDRQARGADLLDQLAEPLQSGHRLASRVLAGRCRASRPACPSIRRMSVSASRLVRSMASSAERDSLRPPIERGQAGAGLDDDHADMMGDDVVQFAGDPLALVLDRPARPLLALGLLEPGVLLDRRGVAAVGSAPSRRAPRTMTTESIVWMKSRRRATWVPALPMMTAGERDGRDREPRRSTRAGRSAPRR